MVDLLINGMIDWLSRTELAVIDLLWRLLSQTVFTTPDVTTLPQVAALTRRSLAVVDATFILAIITVGVMVLARDSLQSRYGVAELLPRLVVGFVAANFAVPLCRTLVQLANAVTGALTGESVVATDSFAQLRLIVTGSMTNPSNQFLIVIIGVFIGALVGMLLVIWLVRLGVLIVLVGISPVALACHATPFTDPAARLWWRALLGTLGTVVLQALALRTTLSIFLDPGANLPTLGLPQDPNGTVNLLIVACLLWVTVKIPALMRRYVTGGARGRNVAGLIVRMLVVQRLTGLLRVPWRGTGGRALHARGGVAPAAMGMIPYRRPLLPRPTPAHRGTPSAAARGGAGPGAAATASGSGPRVPGGGAPVTGTASTVPRRSGAYQPSGTGWPRAAAAATPRTPPAQASGTGWPASPPTARRTPATPARPTPPAHP